MSVIINPGSGPVEGATEEQASANMRAFLDDCGEDSADFAGGGVDGGDGRFSYAVNIHGRVHEIDMPGIPLERVRFMDEPDQNIWDFPRLYVDGSSWVWTYALGVVGPDEDGDE